MALAAESGFLYSSSEIASGNIFESDPHFSSCHASTLAATKDGLVAAWFGGSKEGSNDVAIYCSHFNGKSWSIPEKVADGVQASGKRYPCWNPVLFQPETGPLVLFYKVGTSAKRWWGEYQMSADDGHTWTTAQRMPRGIMGPTKNKPIELPDGSILSGSSKEYRLLRRVLLERSTDNGISWQTIAPRRDGRKYSSIQPTVLRYPRGDIQILCRSAKGRIVESWSYDDGRTWSNVRQTALPNPNSGIDAVILKDGRALLVYNHTKKGRTPLNIALSLDGKLWKGFQILSDPGEYSYPAVIQTADGLVHITYTWNRQRIRHLVIDPSKLDLKKLPLLATAFDQIGD